MRWQFYWRESPRLSETQERSNFVPMPAVILKAHYDGEHIVLDEPFDLPPNSALMVTVLSADADSRSQERAEWAALGAESLARAYGDNEPEYSEADIKERP